MPLPVVPRIPVALAGYPCSSHSGEFPMFTGKLSNSSGTMLDESTSGDVYGRVTNVDQRWQPSPGCGYYRYDAIVWATDNSTTDLTVHWGALSGDAQPCNYVVGGTDYLHANNGACPSATQDRLVATLTPEAVYQQDNDLNSKGDFAFAHSDCITWYTKNVIHTGRNTNPTNGEPGANCGYKQIDGTGTSQSLVVDGTAPTISFTYPTAGGPTVNPAAWASVVFTATDAVAGFDNPDNWTLQRYVADPSGSGCGTTWTADGIVLSGISNQANQVDSQSLALDKCYKWTLGARDENGNTATPITSGIIRTDSSAVLGDQPQFGFESWDLGGGDQLSVSVGSSNVRLTHPIVSLPIRNGTLDLVASYNSHDTGNIGFGTGWRMSLQRRLTVNGDGSVTFVDVDGSRHTFTSPSGAPTVTYTRPATIYATLVRDTAASPDRFTLTYRDQSKDVFYELATGQGYLKEITDRHGNTVTIAYSGTVMNTLTDPAGRTVTFNWTGSNLTSIVDWASLSGGTVQPSGSGNRTHRFFYSGANLIGWADPLNTSGTCSTPASHRTCLTYANGLLSTVVKLHTTAMLSGGAITTTTWGTPPTTTIGYASATSPDVTSVTVALTDSTGATSTFSHPSGDTVAPAQTTVVRPGTPASETTYSLVSMGDSKGRIGTVERKLGSGRIKRLTTYNATYPIEPASIIDNYVNGVAGDGNAGVEDRIVSYTYQASSLGLLAKLDEPLEGTNRRHTDYTYNANNDVTRVLVYQASAPSSDTETRFCYATSGCSTSATDLVLRSKIENYIDGSAGGANGHIEDVTTAYTYDAAGQRTRETRSNYSGGTLIDSAATGWTYDTYGNVTSEIRNYADGTVTNPGDDVTPNGTTNARTDLTTAYAYDTAGNRVSSADPRRAIETAKGISLGADDYTSRTVYDALNQAVTSRLPTSPGIADCGSPPGCREATTTFDELGHVRAAADINNLVTATKYDKAGRALETYEDPAAAAAVTTSVSTYDAAGRTLTTKDQRQVASASLGATAYDYDELGRVTDVTEAEGSSPNLSSITHSTYDNLGRTVTEEIGYVVGADDGQITTWTYDISGRPTKVDDEFTCATTTYDYRGLALTVIEGQASGCTGSSLRTITSSYDGLDRLTNSEITAGQGDNDILAAPTYDAAGRQLSTSATTAGSTTASTFTYNPLDEAIAQVRSEAGTPVSWTKTNTDAAGNVTDRCVWNASPGSELCKAAGSSYTTAPAVSSTSAYDARNQRISLAIPSVGETTYDAAHNYQVAATYVPTGSGKEHQSLYSYDNLHRLTGITQQLCTISSGHSCSATSATGSDAYNYDDNDNRTRVNENNGNASLDRYYC
jgi:YD repeat-containing protein